MSAKKFFQKQKEKSNLRSLTKGNIDQLSSSVESEEHVKQHIEKVDYFVPDVDYSKPENFVKYGSAVQYYADSIKRIYGQYPYDGSEAEKLDFFNNQTPLEKYIFDQKYPKSTGYVKFDADAYITVKAGPHKKNLFNTASNHVNNLQWDLEKGNTIEFWLRKAVFNDDPTPETVLYLTASTSDYFETFLTASQPSKIQINTNYAGSQLSLDTGLSTILDDKWHHYAIVLSAESAGTAVTAKLYTDGQHTDTQTYDSYSGSFDPLKATLGARIDSTQGLTASMDEFRFWRSARTGKEIGRNYIAPVHGGSNTDKNKYYHNSDFDKRLVDLGVYFKFNEGITGDLNQDSLVLDYSGRVSNGSWSTYSSALRSTSSAIVESGVAEREEPDPIIYAIHPEVLALSTELAYSGTVHDETNNASLYNTIPQWIREEDETTQNVLKLTQIMGSYLDTLYGQISEVSNLKSVSPVSSSGGTRMNKPLPFTKRLLTSLGFDISDVFIDKEVIEEILSRSEKKIYETELHEIKNLIYKNIYNNLTFINKSKGTEKSLRNLFRCYGVDDDLININIYADGVEYTLDNTIKTTATKKNLIDFSGIQRETDRSATVYQYPLASGDYGYISASHGDVDIPFSAQTEVIFPDFSPTTLGQLVTSSIFGCHTVTESFGSTATTWAASDSDFQVYAIKADDLRTYFMVTSSNGTFPELTSSQYFDVYDNTKWNFAVRLKPEQYPLSSDISASVNHLFEFYGVNVENGVVFNEFSLSSSISTATAGQFLTGSNKKFYAGSHRTNFTGSVLEQSDVRLSSLRVWNDYLTNEEVQLHAKDPENYGRKNPLQHSFLFEGNTKNNFIPKIDTLALKWDFAVVTGSDASGRFDILDTTSGSSALNQRYPSNNYGLVTKNNHTGRADFFDPNSTNVYTVGFLPTSRQTLPENVHSSDMVNVLSQDDQVFNREGKSVNHYFAIEMSMNQLLSKEMLNFFASVDDFSNQIGEPVHRFRDKYKGLEKLRNLFFERVQNTPDVDKFLKLYKWLDTALDSAVSNLLPISANSSDEVVNVVESHVLERNKYQHKYMKIKSIETNQFVTPVKSTNASYNEATVTVPQLPIKSNTFDFPAIETRPFDGKSWITMTPPLPSSGEDPTEENRNPDYWRFRAERDRGQLVNTQKDVNTGRAQLWSNSFLGLQENRSSVRVKSEATTIFGGPQAETHVWDFYKKYIHSVDTSKDGLVAEFFDDTVSALGEPLEHNNELTSSKRIMPVKVKTAVDGNYEFSGKVLPFKIMSSSVTTGYASGLTGLDQNVDIVNQHLDIYGPKYEIPMQGPYTEENVGGSLYRHGQLLVTSSERMEGFHIKPGTNIISVFGPRNPNGTMLTTKPNGAYYRSVLAKRPVNIRNISGSNYAKDYEIVLTNGRKLNNHHFTRTTGSLPSGAASPHFNFNTGGSFYEYTIPQRRSGDHVIVNKFSSRGGSKVESEGKLDIESLEFSIYNSINYQNLEAKKALNELYTRYTENAGVDSLYGSPIQAFHKIQRNSLRRPSGSITSNTAKEVRDNLWISHAIPRIDTSYRWINDSWVLQLQNPRPASTGSQMSDYLLEGGTSPTSITASEFQPLFGFNFTDNIGPSSSLTLISQSHLDGTNFAGIDWIGTATGYLKEVDTTNNLLSSSNAVLKLNGYLSNLNGPYQHPTWKQIRTGDHIVARYHKQNNIIEATEEAFDQRTNTFKDKVTRVQEAPVSSKHKAVEQFIGDFKIKYSFGNEYNYYSPKYEEAENILIDPNEAFDTDLASVKDSKLYKISNRDDIEWNMIKHTECVYPRGENVYRSIIRDKPNYLIFWKDSLAGRYLNTEFERRVFSTQEESAAGLLSWPMDVHNFVETDVNPDDYDISGELMNLDDTDIRQSGDFGSMASGPGEYARVKYGRYYDLTRPLNQVQEQAGTGALQESYEKFSSDIRVIARDYSLLPQFSISDYVRTIGTQYDFDFYQDIYELELDGASDSDYIAALPSSNTIVTITGSSRNKWSETHVNSDTVTRLGDLKKEFGKPKNISLQLKGLLKLLPEEGFYPVQRTLQLATQFSHSYGPSSTGSAVSTLIPSAEVLRWQTTLSPFYAPGIMYNSIKAGMAVDYPIVDEETFNSISAGSPLPSGSSGSYSKRLPFETIIEPEFYTKKVKGTTDISGSDSIKFYNNDPDASGSLSIINGNATGTLGQTDGVYENMSHNFFAECPNFFLKNLTNFKSSPVEEWRFRGPLSSSGGIKKWAMDVRVTKTDGFTMHDNPGYFGHRPYHHHTPPYYSLRDDSHNYWTKACITSSVGSSSLNNSPGGIPPIAAHYRNTAIAKIVFDPTKIANEDPVKFNSGKFTYEDIVANSTITYINEDLQAQFEASTTTWSGSTIDNKFMKLDASLNLFNKTKNDRWVIGTKWETPVLNFANVDRTSSAGANITLQADRSYAYGGMWHQYGQTCSGSEGLFMTVATSNLTSAEKDLTGSLAEACGFATTQKRIGQLKLQKEIREAVCAIPFYVDGKGQERFFDIPLDSFEQAFNDLQQAKEAAGTVKKKGEEYVLAVDNSISDMIHKMSKYMIIPQYDFVKIREKKGSPIFLKGEYTPALPPFAMYIFEFSALLKHEDLKKVWQGVMPDIAVNAEKQDITLSHPIRERELISPQSLRELELDDVPSDIRWKVFKVKRRANNDYYSMLEDQFDLPENAFTRNDDTLSADFGHNWPYDFCSLVEMGKLEVSFEFDNEKIKDDIGRREPPPRRRQPPRREREVQPREEPRQQRQARQEQPVREERREVRPVREEPVRPQRRAPTREAQPAREEPVRPQLQQQPPVREAQPAREEAPERPSRGSTRRRDR